MSHGRVEHHQDLVISLQMCTAERSCCQMTMYALRGADELLSRVTMLRRMLINLHKTLGKR